jgi:hypothetical protein
VRHYDPNQTPDAVEWLELDEQERIQLVESYHSTERIELPNLKVHAVFHVIVENQLAENLEPVVHTLERLMREGLPRHDALHAIGSVLAEHLFAASKAKFERSTDEFERRYNKAVEKLTAKSWRKRYGDS